MVSGQRDTGQISFDEGKKDEILGSMSLTDGLGAAKRN